MKVVHKLNTDIASGDIIRHPVGDRIYHFVRWVEHRASYVYVATDTCAFQLSYAAGSWVLAQEYPNSAKYRFDLQDLTQ